MDAREAPTGERRGYDGAHDRHPRASGGTGRIAPRQRGAAAGRCRRRGAARHGRDQAVREPRLRGLGAGAPGGTRRRRGAPGLVLERAPRRWLQVEGFDRRLRGRPRVDSALRQRPRRPRGDHHPQHDRLDQPARRHAPRGHARRGLRRRAPRQPPAVEAHRRALSAGARVSRRRPREPGRRRSRSCRTARTRTSSR